MTQQNLMIDLETLGLRPGCQIVSIAAVPFATEKILDPFYSRISISTYFESSFLEPDEETLRWWHQQSEEARAETFSGNDHWIDSLIAFSKYCKQFDRVIPWGNAASFDLKLLEYAFNLAGLPVPWKYYDEMCYRTLKNLFPQISFTKPALAHSALSDAVAQANHATKILSQLQEGTELWQSLKCSPKQD